MVHRATFRKILMDLAFQTSRRIGALNAEVVKRERVNTIWQPLHEGCFEINIVGAARSKPGPTGTGVLMDSAGDAIHIFSPP